MVTTFVARYLPGHGVAQLFWGEPASVSGSNLERDGHKAYTFDPGACFGILWYWRDRPACPHRVLAIARALSNPAGGMNLPGIDGGLEVRVLVEQEGLLGEAGPVENLLQVPAHYSIEERSTPALPFATYLRLRARWNLRPRTLRKLRELFGSILPMDRASIAPTQGGLAIPSRIKTAV